MIKKVSNLTDRYLVTPSLLNSWAYIWNCADNVREAESDECSLEDKIALAQAKAKEDFINVLKRVPTPQNEYMKLGIEFEDETYKGNTCFSSVVKNGCFQIVGKKEITIDNLDFLMYGRLDVLKGGIIYDIKRVSRYSLGKYKKSYQHQFYMELFPTAYKFVYLIFDGFNAHTETYFPNESESIENVITAFIKWLKTNNLYDIYIENWRSK